MKEQKAMNDFLMKEKFTVAVVVFIVGHLLLVPLYMKFPAFFVEQFFVASFSLSVICAAIFDYG